MKNFNSLRIAIVALMLATSSILSVEVRGQQKPDPSAIISVAPLNEQLKDIQYLASATSEAIGQMSGLVEFQVKGFLPGVDYSKPAGALLYFKEGQTEPDALAFFPVKDFDLVLDKISEFAEVEEDGDTVKIIPDNGQEVKLIKKGEYVFVSDKAEMLSDLPDDPVAMLGEQGTNYNFAATVFPQRMPESLKNQALQFIREGFEASLEQMDELQAELQEANFDLQMKQMELLLTDTERLMVGLNVDKDTERLFMDLKMKGAAGSEMEKKLMEARPAAPSQFVGFLMDKAAFTLHNCSGINQEDSKVYVESLKSLTDTLLEEQKDNYEPGQMAVFENLAKALTQHVEKTLMAGTLDMGAAVLTDDGLNAAFGVKLLEAGKLEAEIKKIAADAKSQFQDGRVEFNLDSGSYNGFNLHQITVNVDTEELDESFQKILGEKLILVVGIGADQVYVAGGKDPEATLKKSIDANASASAGKSEFLGQYNFYAAPIMNLISQIDTEQQLVETMRDKIREVGKDRVRFTYDVVDKEMKVQMEVQDGIFQLLGVAVENLQGMGGGGADF